MKTERNTIAPGVNQNVESVLFGFPRASTVPTQIQVNTRISSSYEFNSDGQSISSSIESREIMQNRVTTWMTI